MGGSKWLLAGYGHVGGDRNAIKRALLCHGPLHACGGGHCIVIVGWNANGWVIRNSWGSRWPEDRSGGYGTVDYDDPWCRDAWYVSGIPREFMLNYEENDGLTVGDVHADGHAEIIHGDRSDDRIRIHRQDGATISAWTQDFEEYAGLAAGDVNGDSRAEIIHADRGNWIRVFGMNGNKVREFAVDFEQGDGLAAGDVDFDGRAEIIYGDRGGSAPMRWRPT